MPSGIYKRISEKNRFFLKILKTKNCWIWIGYKDKRGYGKFYSVVGTLAHRFSYFFHKGEIPKGMFVCHYCDNPTCVNPKHLWLGTGSDNQIDCVRKGRANRNSPMGEKNGLSKFKNEDVIKIRQMFHEGKSQAEIAKLFKCHQTNIHYILSGKTWKHVKA